jgi:TatA/E family protein of Tat protein translocase
MNFGFSGEMIFLFFLALILFGPKKLPEIGRQIGRIMNEFRRASNEFRSQIESEIHSLETQSKPQILPPVQAPLGSLASRILNPPSAERREAAEADADRPGERRAAETHTDEQRAAPVFEQKSAATETVIGPPAVPKVAPDA